MTQIIKYQETYMITYKDWNTEEVSKLGWESLIKQLVDKQWVIINWNGYNRFEILNCKKITRDWEALWLLKQELQVVQDKVRWFMKLDKKELTAGRMKEMIRVAKEELHI